MIFDCCQYIFVPKCKLSIAGFKFDDGVFWVAAVKLYLRLQSILIGRKS